MELTPHVRLERTLANVCTLDRSSALIVAAVASQAAAELDILHHSVHAYFDCTSDGTRLYEALLGTYLFAGFPAAIEGLRTAHAVARARGVRFCSQHGEPYSVEDFRKRGRTHFELVYGTFAARVLGQIEEFSRELAEWVIIEGYGKVLSRPSLDIVERERCAIAALAVGGWERQLQAHLRAYAQLGGSREEALDTLTIAGALRTHAEQSEFVHHLLESVWQ